MNRPLTVIDTNVVWALLSAHKGSMLVTGDRCLLLDNPPVSHRSLVQGLLWHCWITLKNAVEHSKWMGVNSTA